MLAEAIVALLTLALTSVVAYLQVRHGKVSAEINDAVNHRHEKRGEGAGKLYDLVWESHKDAKELIEWKRSYDGGPLATGPQVIKFVDEVYDRLDRAENRLGGCHFKEDYDNREMETD